ncbi:Hypothetical protein D9617_19g102030 [Elsinoe fawcettii]|nr:Hypothetical protein D9617_19g102030 [Elsinoe fawcettii]
MSGESVFDLTSLTETLRDLELVGNAPPPPLGVEEVVKVTVLDRIHNAIVSYQMSSNTRMALLMNTHAEMAAYSLDTVDFLLGAKKIMPQDTPHTTEIKSAGGFLSVRPATSR